MAVETSVGSEESNELYIKFLSLPRDVAGLDWDTVPPAWQQSANCLGVDPDLFFPERGGSTREAKEVCRGCVVREECLDYAVENNEKFGVWGGKSERERRYMRRDFRSRRVGRTALR